MSQSRDGRSEEDLLDLEDLVAGFGDDFSDDSIQESEAVDTSQPLQDSDNSPGADSDTSPEAEPEEIEFSLDIEIESDDEPLPAIVENTAPIEEEPEENLSAESELEPAAEPVLAQIQSAEEAVPENLIIEMDDEEPPPPLALHQKAAPSALKSMETEPKEELSDLSTEEVSDSEEDDDLIIELEPAEPIASTPPAEEAAEVSIDWSRAGQAPAPQPETSLKPAGEPVDQEDAILEDVVLNDPPPHEPPAPAAPVTEPEPVPVAQTVTETPAAIEAAPPALPLTIRTLDPAPAQEPAQVKFENDESPREDPSVSEQVYGKGLDIGTANLLAGLQDEQGRTIIKKQRNAFVDIPADSHQKAMLTRLKVPYVVQGKQLYVLGDAAFELANVLNKNTRRPMQAGLLSPKESAAVPVMKLLIENLIGQPRKPGEPIFYSVPGEPIDSDLNVTYHKDIFKALLDEMGYNAQDINEGHSVVISELAEDDFTGIGISCGGGMANACVSYRSLPALTFAVSRGGDWIDNNVANVLGIKSAKATLIKESGMDVNAPKNREEEAVAIYMGAMIKHVLVQIKERFEMSENMPSFPDPIPVVFAGGTPMIKGFKELVHQEFDKLDFPIPVKDVRIAEDPLHAIARGCLLMALSE